MTKRKPLKGKGKDPNGNPIHYYATSPVQWIVRDDLSTIINDMKKKAYPFTVLLVHASIEDDYDIENYLPKGVKTDWIATFN